MKTYRIIDTIRLLGITKKSLYHYNKVGIITFVKENNVNRVTEADFNKMKRNKKEKKESYTATQAAELLGVSRWTVYRFAEKGLIKFKVINGDKMITKKELKRFKESQNGAGKR